MPQSGFSQDKLGKPVHTHIHTFNGPFSGTTRVSWYQKGRINLDFTEARDSEWQWYQLGHMQHAMWVSQDPKNKTVLDFDEARGDVVLGWYWPDHMQTKF